MHHGSWWVSLTALGKNQPTWMFWNCTLKGPAPGRGPADGPAPGTGCLTSDCSREAKGFDAGMGGGTCPAGSGLPCGAVLLDCC